MVKKWIGDKTSLEARSDDGRIWEGELFESGRSTKFTDATLAEVEQLAAEKRMRPAPVSRT